MKKNIVLLALLLPIQLFGSGVKEDADAIPVDDLRWIEGRSLMEIYLPYDISCEDVTDVYESSYDGLNITSISLNNRKLYPKNDGLRAVEVRDDITVPLEQSSPIYIVVDLYKASWDNSYTLNAHSYLDNKERCIVEIPAKNGVVRMSYTVLLPNGCVSEEAVVEWTQYFED